jgi:ketol-acid reductoisomerase
MKDLSQLQLNLTKTKKIAIFGFGSQGKSQALNLRDSGLNIIIALRENSASRKAAIAEGFQVETGEVASKKADIIMLLLPDETHKEIFDTEIKPNFKKGGTIIVAHGLSFHFGLMQNFADYNIGMIAPKAVGPAVRKNFLSGEGIFSLFAKFHEITTDLEDILLEIAFAIGTKRVLETDFKTECETDLFGEQVSIVGGVTSLLTKSFEVLLEAGYNPEIAYYECVQELKLITDLIYEKGIDAMFSSISNTAKYGAFKVGDFIIDESVKVRMKEALKNIQNGSFAQEFMKDKNFKEEIGKKYRDTALIKAGKNVLNIKK